MPPFSSNVGGDAFPVRGVHVWTTSLNNSPTSSQLSASSLDSNISLLSSLDAASSESSAEDSDDSEATSSSDSDRPPSPPVKTIVLSNIKAAAASPASSVESSDYFSAKLALSTFLNRVFPRSKLIKQAVPVKAGVANWQLAVFDQGLEDSPRTLYARGGAGFEDMNLRENLVELLDHADEALDCDSVVVVLDKKDPNLASILHSLMYVGGVVIPASVASIHGKHSSKSVLVGIDL